MSHLAQSCYYHLWSWWSCVWECMHYIHIHYQTFVNLSWAQNIQWHKHIVKKSQMKPTNYKKNAASDLQLATLYTNVCNIQTVMQYKVQEDTLTSIIITYAYNLLAVRTVVLALKMETEPVILLHNMDFHRQNFRKCCEKCCSTFYQMLVCFYMTLTCMEVLMHNQL